MNEEKVISLVVECLAPDKVDFFDDFLGNGIKEVNKVYAYTAQYYTRAWLRDNNTRFDGGQYNSCVKVLSAVGDVVQLWSKHTATKINNQASVSSSVFGLNDRQLFACALDLEYTEQIIMDNFMFKDIAFQVLRDQRWTNSNRPQFHLFCFFSCLFLSRAALLTHIVGNIKIFLTKSPYIKWAKKDVHSSLIEIENKRKRFILVDHYFPGWEKLVKSSLNKF